MERRNDDRRWEDKAKARLGILYERLDNRLHNVENLANETRAEFRAVRDELKKKVSDLESKIQAETVKSLTDTRTERKEVVVERWKLITVVVGQLIFMATTMMLNWERFEDFAKRVAHRYQAVEQPVEQGKKPRRHAKKKKAAPPIVLPETRDDSPAGEVQQVQ